MPKILKNNIPGRFRATFQARKGAVEHVFKLLWDKSGIKNAFY
jgi:hypothetical protein